MNIQILYQIGRVDEVNWFEVSHEELGGNKDYRFFKYFIVNLSRQIINIS